jgi:hypothetical protein
MPDPETEAGVTEVTTEAASESTVAATEDTTQTTGTTADTSTGGSEESFFDPSTLDESLLPAYKQMQGHFTRSMQSLKSQKDKIAAYDAFQTNPRDTIKQLAGQYGLTLQEAAQVATEFEPQDWNDVTKHVTDAVLAQLGPVMSEVRSVKQSSIEQQLDSSMPEWREYETDMQAMLGKHPTLADDPVMLARMVIPEAVQQSKAMQAAMRKLEQKAKASSVTSGTQTSKEPDPLTPGKKMTFAESVVFAKRKLAAEAK